MKLHLIISEEPVTSRSSQALCGKEVELVDSLGTDVDLRFVSVNSLGSCVKCSKLAAENKSKVNVYLGRSL